MIEKALKEAGVGVVKDLRASFAAKDVNASGRLSRTLKEETTSSASQISMNVSAEGYVFEVEEGTPPPGKGGPRVFVADILKWLDDRSIRTAASFGDRDAMAYVIARKINKEGTRRYRENIKTGAISDVVNDALIADIERKVLEAGTNEAIEGIDKAIKTSRNE